MNTVNVESSLFTRHLSLYADVGIAATIGRDFRGNEIDQVSDFAYNFGIAVNVIPNFFEFYFPITSSSELNNFKYYEKVRFVLQLNMLDPFHFLRKFELQ